MTRYMLFVSLLLLLVPGLAPVRADDDEPTFADKKLSYWLGELSEGKDAKARMRGMIGVEQIGHYGSRKVVPALVKALREDKEEQVRARAAQAVGRACAKALEQARADKKDELPRFDTARDALAQTLRTDKADAVRESAARGIGHMGSDARGAVGALGLALKDKHAATVTASASALRRMGKDAREAEGDLLAVVGNDKAELEARTESVVALGQFKADAGEAIKVMRPILADAKADVKLRRAIAETFGKWGKEAGDASATLGIVLIEPKTSEELRLAAMTALDQMGSAAAPAVPALIKAIDDNDRIVRCLAMQSIGKIGRDLDKSREPAIKAILKATEDSNIEVAVSAVETLGVLSIDGLGELKAAVSKRLEDMLRREGRKALRDATQAAKDKIDPPKKKDKE